MTNSKECVIINSLKRMKGGEEMEISKRKIKNLMATQALTTKALAERMNTQPNNLSTVLTRGTCYPDTAIKIANALGVSVEEIVKEEA